MRRRHIAGLALLPLLARAAAAAMPGDIAFRVVREGAEVGTHRVRFREEAGALMARSEVRIQVRLMGITVYRYAHDMEEAWRADRLVALASRLDRNGTARQCEARAEGAALLLRGSGGEARLPGQAMPLNWWRMATLAPGATLFDPREGRVIEPRLERAAVAGGTRVTVIGGEGAVALYDAEGRWTGFATTGEDGSAVRYERV
jgi:hypothetical protein